MEKQVIFRDYQEQQAQDHNDIQDFVQTALEHFVGDVVTASRRYAGFTTMKTAQAEVQIAGGRFYDTDGAVYHREATLVQSMVSYLPAVSRRIVLVSVSGSTVETEVEERDFLVDVATGRTEPDAVSTVRSRDAVVSLTSGAESADAQAPAIPSLHAGVAYITLDTTGVVEVQMIASGAVVSTEGLGLRAALLEAFKAAIEPRVLALASDLAALAARIGNNNTGATVNLVRIYQDIARLKEAADLPQTYSDYGSDNYQSVEHSDTEDEAGLGYDARITNGLTFAVANQDISEVSLFSALDPNVSVSAGLVLPKHSHVLRMQTGEKTSELSISQYGYQTFDIVKKTITRYRLRYGPYWCWYYPYYYPWYYGFYGLWPDYTWAYYLGWYGAWPYAYHWFHGWYYPFYWYEAYTEVYWDLEKTEHTINGAQVAQTFLNSNDAWVTKVGFYITAKGANEPIYVTLCEVELGQPNLSKALAHQTYAHGDIEVGWNRMEITPTFLKSGTRYALVFTSEANHKIGMTSGQSYLDGTFFYSTDTAYYLGDLTKDMMIEIWAARFDAPQCTVEFAPINLDGGVRAIDLMARAVVPDGAQMSYEVRAPGGDWMALNEQNIAILAAAPPLLQFRGRFIGTRDVAPGLLLTGSRLDVSRPKTSFRHVSAEWTLGAATTSISVQLTLTNFDDTPHDCTCRLRIGEAYENPDTTVDEVVDAATKTIKRTFAFSPSSMDTFRIEINGSTTSSGNLFVVSDMVFWSVV